MLYTLRQKNDIFRQTVKIVIRYAVSFVEKCFPGLITTEFFENTLASSCVRYKLDIKKSREEVKKGHVYTMEEAFKGI